jgi:hypothetical protein
MRHSIPQDDGPKRRWPRIVGRASFRIENKVFSITIRGANAAAPHLAIEARAPVLPAGADLEVSAPAPAGLESTAASGCREGELSSWPLDLYPRPPANATAR